MNTARPVDNDIYDKVASTWWDEDGFMHLKMRNELLRILQQERHTVLLITHDVEEAIHVADRVLVLSPRPCTIKASFDVPFAHPRKLSSQPVQELRTAILRELGVEQE